MSERAGNEIRACTTLNRPSRPGYPRRTETRSHRLPKRCARIVWGNQTTRSRTGVERRGGLGRTPGGLSLRSLAHRPPGPVLADDGAGDRAPTRTHVVRITGPDRLEAEGVMVDSDGGV